MAGLNARRAREQDAATAERLLEEVRRRLGCEPSRDLAHRSKQGQPMVVRFDGLVGDGGDAAVHEGTRQWLVGRDVEIREEHEPLA